MQELIEEIKNNMTLIKEEILNNKSNSLETLVMSSLNTVVA